MAVDNIARGLAASALKKGGVTTEQLEEGLAKKLDKAGGTIGGNIVITGDLTVNGTQHINNTENLNVENAMIYSNANGATLAANGGIGIKKDATDVYGIVYDPTSDSVKLGLGESDTNGVFTFNENEGQPVAIRDNSSKFTNNNLVKWDSENHKLVDAGQSVDNLGSVEVDNKTITKTPNEEIQAVALTNGTDLLTYAEILQATTIERL